MKSKILLVLLILLLCGATWLICSALQSDTVDFRGYVNEVTYDTEKESAVIYATGVFNSEPFAFRVGKRVSVKNSTGDRISVEDIRPGDMIDVDYKGQFDNETKSVDVRRLEVWPKQ